MQFILTLINNQNEIVIIKKYYQIDVIQKDVSKINALKWICSNMCIDIKDTIAFGDKDDWICGC